MFEITKGFLLRAFFMYMIASFFRKSPSTPDSTTTPARPPALNYFENSTLMVSNKILLKRMNLSLNLYVFSVSFWRINIFEKLLNIL